MHKYIIERDIPEINKVTEITVDDPSTEHAT